MAKSDEERYIICLKKADSIVNNSGVVSHDLDAKFEIARAVLVAAVFKEVVSKEFG